MSVPAPRRPAWPLALVFASFGALACASADEGEAASGEDEAAEQGEGEGETGEEPAAGDICEVAPVAVSAPSSTRASLRNATPSPIPAACGIDGPVVFFDVHVAARVDLAVGVTGREAATKLAVMRPGCLDTSDDPTRVLACADALPVTLFDLGPDASLSVAVGIGADDPALALEPADDPDPLEFELALATRAVLAHGQACGLPNTRCEAGTVCSSEAALDPGGRESGETGDQDDALRCLRPEADSCTAPGTLTLELDVAHELVIAPDELHSDAHEHPCTGWRRPERVEQLELPPAIPPGAALVVRADDGRVGLALRGSSCLVEDTLACAAHGAPDETFLVWDGPDLDTAAADGHTPLLFIELPRADPSDASLDPIGVHIEIISE